ncbi:hypothetical protein AOXY_G38120 [Acipenser oxyrinchus oxyrinchus]|uniref:C2H2-type domain-containing protein n=1 Tax=Acipenser oxyrinchus oxyrinchus TaxID=40147 RepID=A0AAD8CDF1_ACIOX|nr:hypothetical protein AOXY_G38120 [Acipenser oxyrinchus oxyrinchus]
MIHTGEKPLQCEICGFTCRQKASLNWHMRRHDAGLLPVLLQHLRQTVREEGQRDGAQGQESPEILIAEALAASQGPSSPAQGPPGRRRRRVAPGPRAPAVLAPPGDLLRSWGPPTPPAGGGEAGYGPPALRSDA